MSKFKNVIGKNKTAKSPKRKVRPVSLESFKTEVESVQDFLISKMESHVSDLYKSKSFDWQVESIKGVVLRPLTLTTSEAGVSYHIGTWKVETNKAEGYGIRLD